MEREGYNNTHLPHQKKNNLQEERKRSKGTGSQSDAILEY